MLGKLQNSALKMDCCRCFQAYRVTRDLLALFNATCKFYDLSKNLICTLYNAGFSHLSGNLLSDVRNLSNMNLLFKTEERTLLIFDDITPTCSLALGLPTVIQQEVHFSNTQHYDQSWGRLHLLSQPECCQEIST